MHLNIFPVQINLIVHKKGLLQGPLPSLKSFVLSQDLPNITVHDTTTSEIFAGNAEFVHACVIIRG